VKDAPSIGPGDLSVRVFFVQRVDVDLGHMLRVSRAPTETQPKQTDTTTTHTLTGTSSRSCLGHLDPL
jgi:hypothetical protein